MNHSCEVPQNRSFKRADDEYCTLFYFQTCQLSDGLVRFVKMFYCTVFLLVLAGTVKSSVIINVIEDGEIKASHSQYDDCNFRACDQLCRRLGFTGGVCVGDRCKCDNFVYSPDHFETTSSAIISDLCDVVQCNEICKRLNFIGGMCIGGNCKCY